MNKSFFQPFVIALAILFPATASLSAEHELKLNDELLFRTGTAFQHEREYYRAITEYKKLLILFPKSESAEDAHFNIGISYLEGGEYASAAETFKSLRQKFPQGRHFVQSHLYEGQSYRKGEQYKDAVIQFDTVIEEFPRAEEAPKAFVGKALLALDTYQIDEMRSELGKVVREFPDTDVSRAAEQSLALAETIERLPKKSTVLAAGMSAVLPGSGYIYAGAYGDGLTAFLVNAVFIAGTATAVHQRNYPTAYIVGVVGLPFYIGNIYGSANAARKWNLALQRDIEGKIYSLLEFHY